MGKFDTSFSRRCTRRIREIGTDTLILRYYLLNAIEHQPVCTKQLCYLQATCGLFCKVARNWSLYWLRCPSTHIRWSAVVNSQRNFTFTVKMNMPTADTQQRMCGSSRWGQIVTSCKRIGISNSSAAVWFRPLFSILHDYFGGKILFWYNVYEDVSSQILNNLCSQNALHTRTLLERLWNRLLNKAVKNGNAWFDGLYFISEIWESLRILISF